MPTTFPAARQPIVTIPDQPDTATINDTVQALEDKVGITGSTDTTSLDYKTAQTGKIQGRDAMYVQSDTTNVLTNNQVIYRGWGYINGNATNEVSKTVTLPNGGYDDANYSVAITYMGDKNTGVPTSQTDVTGRFVQAETKLDNSAVFSATQFKADIYTSAGNFAAGTYEIFSWITVGTKA